MKTIFPVVFVLVLANAEAQSLDSSVADSLYAIGNYTTAINEYAKVASPNAELQIARAYNAIGNYEKAMLQYENIVQKMNPKNWQYMNLAGYI